MKTNLKDFYGRIIGSVDELSNGDKVYRDFYGRIVARWEKSRNITRNFYGRIVSKGDVGSSFLMNTK